MLVTIVLTFVTLVIGELAPKRIAMQRTEGWALLVARPLDVLSTFSRPAVWLLGESTNLVVRLAGGDPTAQREEVTTEEIRDMVAAQQDFSDRAAHHHQRRVRDRRPDPAGDPGAPPRRAHACRPARPAHEALRAADRRAATPARRSSARPASTT